MAEGFFFFFFPLSPSSFNTEQHSVLSARFFFLLTSHVWGGGIRMEYTMLIWFLFMLRVHADQNAQEAQHQNELLSITAAGTKGHESLF